MISATDNRTTELLPCPFCGGEAEVIRNDIGVFIGCFHEDCPIGPATSTYVDGYSTEAEAIEAWNTRAERMCQIVTTWKDSDYIDDVNYKCSECGGFIPVYERNPDDYFEIISAANYCPNCGAKVVNNDN